MNNQVVRIGITFLLFTVFFNNAKAQNVGIGVNNPANKLEVAGNMVVKAETITSNTAPTPGQHLTLVNGSSIFLPGADSVYRIYDPGGPSGNYLANLSATVSANASGTIYGFELQLEEVQLGTGDSLIITNTGTSTRLLAVGNDYATTGSFTFQAAGIAILFKSNADASLGTGFSLLLKKLYLSSSGSAVQANSLVGPSFYFDTKNSALRAGIANTGNVGVFSTAIGNNNIAQGNYSFAVGNNNKSIGTNSFASGQNNNVNGNRSFVHGVGNNVASEETIVFGSNNNNVSGASSMLLGVNNTNSNAPYNFLAGFSNQASNGFQSFLLGSGLINAGSFCTSIGISNALPPTINNAYGWDTRDPLLIVGNGYSTPSNALMMLKSGYTGIGIDEPLATLHVKEKIIIDQPAATGLASMEWRSNNTYRGGFGYDHTAGRFFFFEGESGQNVFFINNGRFGIRRDATTNALEVGGEASKSTAGSWLGNSDARLKKNIFPVTHALNKLLQLKGVQYEWNDDKTGYPRPAGLQMGFTAQNVQEVFPEKVSTDAQGYLQTAYGTYDPLIVEAIRELKNENDLLKKELAEIKKMLEKN